jgi:hypothetical protein
LLTFSENAVDTDPLRMILPANTTENGRFYVAFRAENQRQFDQIQALPDPKVVTGPKDLGPGQALSCGPIKIGDKMFPVLHIRTAETLN